MISVSNGFLTIQRDGGVEMSDDGMVWKKINNGIPEKFIYPFEEYEPRDLTNISYDYDSDSVVVCGSDFLSISTSGTENWINIPIKFPIKNGAFFTAAAVSSTGYVPKILLGTSCFGIFQTEDLGETWKVVPSGKFYVGGDFYHEITALCFGGDVYKYYAASGDDNFLYGFNPDKNRWVKLTTPDVVAKNTIYAIENDGKYLLVFTSDGVFTCSFSGTDWKFLCKLPLKQVEIDVAKQKRMEKAAGKNGIYLSWKNGKSPNLKQNIEFLEKHGMNSFVIDLKDDMGHVTCGTENQLAKSAGADKNYFSLEELLDIAHSHGIYVIGRIVVFKDETLYNYNNFQYAAKGKDGKPWRNMIKNADGESVQKEFWLDAFSEDVWEYNISLAKEFQDRGIDEIQFDYIRFPTDGPVSDIEYNFNGREINRQDALESFLKKARIWLDIPVCVDFYGFSSWYKVEKWNGQNIDMALNYVDVVSPMYYPSHFSRDFYKTNSYTDWSRLIYEKGTIQANKNVRQKCLIRPFLQAFLIMDERKMEKDEYYQYLLQQVLGCNSGSSSGFTLWNASNRYYMVPDTIQDYIISQDDSDQE